MKRIIRALTSLVLVLTLSLPVSAFAADGTITFQGFQKGFDFRPGSEYTLTDLFGNFKNVMPGEIRTEILTFTNNAADRASIALTLRAEAHWSAAAKEETAASMADFLSQLTIQVSKYDAEQGYVPLYEASPDQLDHLNETISLGTFRPGETATLKVELTIPASLGNEYANRTGEVDWVFRAEEYIPTDPKEPLDITVRKKWSGDEEEDRPKQITVTLYDGKTVYETVTLSAKNDWSYHWYQPEVLGNWVVVETDIPKGYLATYSVPGSSTVTITNTRRLIQTGQDYLPILALSLGGLALMTLGGAALKKKRKNA